MLSMLTYSESPNNIEDKKYHWRYHVRHVLFRAGIGDGGNDVGMIQLASIGLGIVGK